MGEEKPSVWIILVPILMLFVSGAWTLASLIPYVRWGAMRETMFYTVIISNISFLVSLLLSMLFYRLLTRGDEVHSAVFHGSESRSFYLKAVTMNWFGDQLDTD